MVDESEIYQIMNAEIGLGMSRWQNRPPAYNIGINQSYDNINIHTYDGVMPTNYGTIMGRSNGGYEAPILSFGSSSRNIGGIPSSFSLDGTRISVNPNIAKNTGNSEESAKGDNSSEGKTYKAKDYSYRIVDGTPVYKSPDGKEFMNPLEYAKAHKELSLEEAQALQKWATADPQAQSFKKQA